jgi:signal transduction histidine kinase
MTDSDTDAQRHSIDETNHRIWEAAHEDPDGSLEEARRLEQRAADLGYRRGRAEALRTQGYALAILDDIEGGFEKHNAALEILSGPDVHEPDVLATLHDSIANLYYFVGMYAQSFENSRLGIEYAREAGSVRVEAYCLRNLGMIYLAQQDHQRARELFLHSRSLFESIEYRIGVGWTLLHLGQIEAGEGRDETALEYFREVLSSVSEREFAMLHAGARNGAARCLWKLGKLSKAKEIADEAVEAPRSFGQIRAESQLIRGHIYHDLGETDRALEIFAETAELAARSGELSAEMESREERARLLAERGDFESAYREQVKASGTQSRLTNNDSQRELRYAELRYNLEAVRKEAEQRRLRDLERMNQELEERVQRRTQDLEEERGRLERTNRELTRISNERHDLIRILSHDLRSPFAAIKEILQFIEGKAEERDYVALIDQSATNGLELIDSVRHLLAVESGKAELHIDVVPLQPAVQEAVRSVEPSFREKGIHFEVDVDAELRILADRPTFVSSVLANLLSNAAKFSPDHSTVSVRAGVDDGHVQLTVEDRGIGMSQELAKTIFDPFAATNREGTKGESGTGFGMPLTKRLVERYGGSVSIDSSNGSEDHGTSVTLRVPTVPES